MQSHDKGKEIDRECGTLKGGRMVDGYTRHKDHSAAGSMWVDAIISSTYLGQYNNAEDCEESYDDEKGHAGSLSRSPCAFLASLLQAPGTFAFLYRLI